MREQYHKQGSPYELSFEQKQELGLIEPSSWSLEKLDKIQNKIAEPLVLYWLVFPLFFIQYNLCKEMCFCNYQVLLHSLLNSVDWNIAGLPGSC